jgi:hypothetical protein
LKKNYEKKFLIENFFLKKKESFSSFLFLVKQERTQFFNFRPMTFFRDFFFTLKRFFNTDYLVEYFYNLFLKKAPNIDKKWFDNNKKNKLLAARFFYFTSFITSFFFFSKKGRLFVSIFSASTFMSTLLYFKTLVAVFAEYGLLSGLEYMVLALPLSFLSFIIFVIVLVDLSWINTFLVCCPSVSSEIKLLYGDNFIKTQYYNSGMMTAKVSAQFSRGLIVGVASGVAAGTVLNIYGEHQYASNYAAYVNARIQNPDVPIQPPVKGPFSPFFHYVKK